MSYYDIYLKYKDLPFDDVFRGISSRDIEKAVNGGGQDIEQFLALLSPAAENHLEDMAREAHETTLKHFGRTVQLYTPLYLSNYCENQCLYCGFNTGNNVVRKKLNPEEVEKEAVFIASTGLEHILILTGDSREKSPVSYVKDCIGILRKYFNSISVEIYALTETEYAEIINEGADGLTLYQETYDEEVYARMHPAGPKKDYLFRLNAPERAAKNGIRNLNTGVLLGLNDWRKEAFFMGLHAKYLQDKFCDVEISASVPRLRPHAGDFTAPGIVSDADLAGIITALRIFLPRLGITLSTRESAGLRDNILPLGVTRMSAGSSTKVGGHTIDCREEMNSSQFEIADTRDVDAVKSMLAEKGYQAVLKDWTRI
jgi:2-iminoacetate synthase